MLETSEFRDERAELEQVLASGIFNRAPHLHSFLSYVCERYFDGEADKLKEYTIAVEALRRQAGFDPKKDSIVRVEAHRLRRRLAEYYDTKGRNHRVRIAIPCGQYVPQFTYQPANSEAGPESGRTILTAVEPEPAAPASMPADSSSANIPELIPPIQPERSPWIWLVPALLVSFLLAAVYWGTAGATQASINGNETWIGNSAQPVPAEFRMLAGYHGAAFTDRQGRTWNPDAYFTGGVSSNIPSERIIQGTPDPRMLRTQRSGDFSYDIPLRKGVYELRLYFAETEYGLGNPLGGSETARLFTLSINGAEVIRRFDPIAESGGPNRLLVRAFKDISAAPDGKLHLSFGGYRNLGRQTSPAILNAIEVMQSRPGLVHPIRIVTQEHPVTDFEGRSWSSDQFFYGGTLAFHEQRVLSSRDEGLYRGERYGNFAYHIPLASGRYRVTLHFAETWFGTPESNEPGPGSRRFNVFANGAALLQDFDIAKEAGTNREVVRVFENLQPNAQGALWLEFVPLENYALVNAIEVEPME